MGHIGFSWVGALFLLALLLPNVAWTRAQPTGYDPGQESRVLQALERVGQAATVAAALAFSDTNPQEWSAWSLWLVAAVALMAAYELGWIRYFASDRTMRDFYGPLAGVPLPLATLPVAAFLLLGVYGQLLPLIAASVVLGIGHIGIHAGHWARIRRT